MAKIMLVEDDNNLREIYEARLLAEGYEIVSAHDGEEALALAVKEKPDLIISDVMMPKISGFDMLDILRSTPETKDTKVIMMTALSQAEDKSRADKLGADRYLVKSQVTLEDVAKIAREVLDGTPPSASPSIAQAPTPATLAPAAEPVAAPAPIPESPSIQPLAPVITPTEPVAAPAPVPVADPTPVPVVPVPVAAAPVATPPSDPVVPVPVASTPAPTPPATDLSGVQSVGDEQAKVESQIKAFTGSSEPGSVSTAPAPNPPTPDATTDVPVNISGKKIISPINDLSSGVKPDLNALAAAEEQKEAAAQSGGVTTPAQPSTPPGPDPNLIAL